jgi:hypothetical protein
MVTRRGSIELEAAGIADVIRAFLSTRSYSSTLSPRRQSREGKAGSNTVS